ncbi:MBL fold metallo-hydrolase [bacterium]|nr:MBL fold metallo-hydrolase [bacterium]
MAKIQFLGATGTTTGSKFLFEHNGFKILIDCGLFQGLKQLRLRNWAKFPINPAEIDAVALTHAHIDHTGYLPRIVKTGFSGKVYSTKSTADLGKIMLLDSAHLQEEDAKWANKKGFSKHSEALPLYDKKDAEAAIQLFHPLPYEHTEQLTENISIRFRDAGHILGSAFIIVEWKAENGEKKKLVFSGDIGRPATPILRDPSLITEADFMVIESTYGNRLHGEEHPKVELARIIRESATRQGVLLIPSFSVGRTQALLYTIRELEETEEIPPLPIFVDSPMASRATKVFKKNWSDHDLESALLEVRGTDIFRTRNLKFTDTTKESMALNDFRGPGIIISASGMLSGGRILHHLANKMPHPLTTILFIGYQAKGTRGRAILEGAESVKIHGNRVAVKAHIENISGFSAHADYQEIFAWLRGFEKKPKQTFVVHGEQEYSESMAEKLNANGFKAMVPEYCQTVELV